MNTLYRPSAAAALFVAAALVACHGAGGGGYAPTVSPEFAPNSASHPISPATGIVCKSPKVGPGTYMLYAASGNVKGSTFTEFTGPSGGGGWTIFKYAKAKPTPTPAPSPTPKPVTVYLYYGTFATKNKFTGCAVLATTVNGKPIIKGDTFNAITDGVANIKLAHFSLKEVDFGFVSALTISHLSSNGGSGTGSFVTTKKKPYTTVSITLIGRVKVKTPEAERQFIESLYQTP
jgi:hypothetical protein